MYSIDFNYCMANTSNSIKTKYSPHRCNVVIFHGPNASEINRSLISAPTGTASWTQAAVVIQLIHPKPIVNPSFVKSHPPLTSNFYWQVILEFLYSPAVLYAKFRYNRANKRYITVKRDFAELAFKSEGYFALQQPPASINDVVLRNGCHSIGRHMDLIDRSWLMMNYKWGGSL